MRAPIVLLVSITLLAACSSKQRTEEARATAPSSDATAATTERAPEKARPPRIFDADGKLYASQEYAGGLAMPVGVELFRADELTRVYRIRAPIDKVLAYFGPRLITGNVKRLGDGAVYKQASVKGAEVNPTKIDVSILEIGSNLVRIQIRQIPPGPEYSPSATQTKSAARDQWRMLD
jgi:hypothetical protein